MRFSKLDFDPVTIALNQIEMGTVLRFTGLDLDSGAPITLLVEHPENIGPTAAGLTFDANGLVLVLAIEDAN